jgi:protein TonB
MAAVARTTSLIASAGLLGAAVIAALTMSITMLPPPQELGGVIIDALPEPRPEPLPPVVRPTTRPPPTASDAADEAVTEPPPPTDSIEISDEVVTDPGPRIETITRPHWLRRPSNLQSYYPRRALQNEINGDVMLDCLVAITGALRCSVISETPEQWGFGAAALRIAGDYRMEPAIRNGVAVEGRYRMRVPFRVE